MIEEQIFIDGDLYFESLSESIKAARKSIYLEMYIFELDALGLHLLSLLAEAAARGVRTRLLIDGWGSPQWNFAQAVEWRKKGIELKFFHPLLWQKHPQKIWQYLSLKKFLLGLSKINHRNHRKVCIVDDQILFIGGMNVSELHLPSKTAARAWRDTSVKVTGRDLSAYIRSCEHDWNFAQNFYGARWLSISQRKRRAFRDLLRLLLSAKSRVWITNPYFVPGFRLTRVLARLAKRGVDVRLLLPARSDIMGLKFAIEGLYTLLLTFRVKVFEYLPSPLHAKVLIIDDLVRVGSSNLDHRSIFNNLEADVILSQKESKEEVCAQFLNDLSVSKPVELETWKKRSYFFHILESFFLSFRNYL